MKLKGVYFETDYADFVAWAHFGHPGESVDNCFAMAALLCADGAFLLGEMAQHTFSAGEIYFPAGTPDPNDVFDGKVDLEASARRELFEETGVKAEETIIASGWTLVFTPQRIACMKLMTLPAPAAWVKARNRGLSGGGPACRVFAHACHTRPARHRRNPGADLRRRLPARCVRSKIGRVTVTLLRGGDH